VIAPRGVDQARQAMRIDACVVRSRPKFVQMCDVH
jgi:hypothetical protein